MTTIRSAKIAVAYACILVVASILAFCCLHGLVREDAIEYLLFIPAAIMDAIGIGRPFVDAAHGPSFLTDIGIVLTYDFPAVVVVILLVLRRRRR